MPGIQRFSQPLAVVKVGGSILTNTKAYRRVAVFVRNRHRRWPEHRLVVVVSAQEGVTDGLELAAKRIAPFPAATALDLLLSTGELRSVALLVLHLQTLGIPAAGLNVHEAGLSVTQNGSQNEKFQLNPRRLRSALRQFPVAVVPGFFATDTTGAVVSLGRGGSDLTAVLLAEGLQADCCELLKDVHGYFSSDPHRDPHARHLPALTYDEALARADRGCDLVQRKAIEAASRCNLPLIIRSIDESAPFTRIAAEAFESTWQVRLSPPEWPHEDHPTTQKGATP